MRIRYGLTYIAILAMRQKMHLFRKALAFFKLRKDLLAVLFSTIALLFSAGRSTLDFFLPRHQLSFLVEANSSYENFGFSISEVDGNLRIDPILDFYFMNGSSDHLLIKQVSLVSPIGKNSKESDICESPEIVFNMSMFKFVMGSDISKDAEPFPIKPGEIVSVRIRFDGINNLHDPVSIEQGIPICVQVQAFDAKGRMHESHVFSHQVIEAVKAEDGLRVSWNNFIDQRAVQVINYNALWDLLH